MFLGLADPAGIPIPIVPSKTERMHSDDPNLTVLAMFYPSDYFNPHGSHTFLVDIDLLLSWANAGKNYFEAKDILPLTEVARTTLNYDWIMTFSPMDGDKWYETGPGSTSGTTACATPSQTVS